MNKIIDDIVLHPFEGIGKTEPLKYNLDICWSRRINKADRIVYTLTRDSIIQCRYHY